MLIFSVANENKLTRLQVRQLIDSSGQELTIIDCFSQNDLLESPPKRVVSEHAESDRSFFTLKCVRGPFDEFCEVKKECRFDLILDRWTGLWLDISCDRPPSDSHGADSRTNARPPQPAAPPSPVPPFPS